jgi:parvulin-like peptidyl-prolyl isomerase
VNYVVVRRSWVEKYVIPAEQKDIDAWSKDKVNLAQIKVPVRHVLVKFPSDKPEDKDASKAKAQGIFDRIKKGEDFAKLAKEFSDDPGSKDKGGQYPGADVEHFVPEFKASVAALKPGELDQKLVQTSYGYHIIKRDPATKEDILRDFKAAKSDEIAKAMAKDINDAMKAGKTADEAIAAAIAKYGKYTPKVEKPAATAGTKAADGGATAASDAGPAVETFTADKDPLRPQVLTSSAFNRGGDPIPAISSEATEAIVSFAFSAKPAEVAAEPVHTDDGYIVVQLKEHKAATKEDFDKERDTYELTLLGAKQNEALAYYVRRLRETSKQDIKVDENNLFGAKTDAGAPRDDEEE